MSITLLTVLIHLVRLNKSTVVLAWSVPLSVTDIRHHSGQTVVDSWSAQIMEITTIKTALFKKLATSLPIVVAYRP